MISFIQVIDVLRTFAQGHFQIQKFDFEFREQMPNLATVNEAYPMLYVVPVGTSNIQFGKEFDLDIYCVDRYKKDRSNVSYVISDTELILSDLSVYLENQTAFDSSYGSTTPINNDLLDYVGGHVMRIRVTVEKQALCELPFDSEAPTPPTCPSALVRNSDGTWSEIVPSGATYILPDTPVTVLDSDGNVLFTTDLVSITGGNVTAPDATYLVEYENGTPIESGSILSGGSVTVQVPDPIVCEDATAELYFDGELIDTLTIPSGDTDSFSIDCNTLLNAVRVEAIGGVGHQHGGTFVLNGEVNGKDSYVKSDDPDRIIYYDGTRWVLEKIGGGAHTHEAAIGNEDYPWEADWTLEDLIVTQATIGTYCANGASCEDATWTLLDTDGNVLDSGTIASGDSANIIAPDGTVVNSDSTYTDTVASGGTLVLPDTVINITDQLGNPLDTITFPVYTPVNIDIDSYIPPCADANYTLEDTAGAPLASGTIPSGGSNTIVAPDATIENSDASYSVTEVSGGTLVLPDSDIEVNGVNEGAIPSVNTVDIQVTDGTNPVTPNDVTVVGNTVTIEVPAASAPVGATLMKTGQTTSYRTGDDGDFEAGRATDFFTLASNNPFGNTNRFTDELGGSTYANDIVIDWSTFDGTTVLGYRRTDNGVNINWNNAIDGALAVSIGTFTTGWRLPNAVELFSLINWSRGGARVFDYSPFNLSISSMNFWISNTYASSSSLSYMINNGNGQLTAQSKTTTTSMRYIPCRVFTWNGTNLI